MKQFETITRAKRTDNNKWIEGYFAKFPKRGSFIFSLNENIKNIETIVEFSVDSDTACVWTNHNDKNGKKIFTNDFYRDEEDEPVICLFIKETSYFAFLHISQYLVYKHDGFEYIDDCGIPFNINDFDCEKISICGNIIDKELEKLVSEDEKRYKKGSI